MLSERSHTQRTLLRLHAYEMFKIGKFMETNVGYGRGLGRMRDLGMMAKCYGLPLG